MQNTHFEKNNHKIIWLFEKPAVLLQRQNKKKMINTMSKEINHADKGLIPAYPFSTKRSVVYGDYYIEKHRYRTNRNAIVEIWDVYLGTDLQSRIKSFSTLKAAKGFCYECRLKNNNSIGKEIKTLVVLSVGEDHPLYEKEVEAIITPCTGYDGRGIDATTTEEILFPERKDGILIFKGKTLVGRKDAPAHKEKVTAWVERILDPATNKWMSSEEYSERMELKKLLSKYPDNQ